MRRAAWSLIKGLDEFDRLVELRDIGVAFQPIVDMRDGAVVAYEALARPPETSSFPGPESLFAEAYRRGRVGELDWVCRRAVFQAALEKKVPPELPLFVNVEPMAVNAPCPADIIGLFAAATNACRFVVEVTERSLADDPAELLAAVGRTRDVHIGVALDDVGADPASLALMPLVAPDVIKLDLRLIQGRPTPEVARIVSAVLAESERTGAHILAEGVESERHRAVARSMGATLGQGWLFGPPAPLPDSLTPPPHPLESFSPPDPLAASPFTMASGIRVPVASSRELLAATSRYLENQVLETSGRSVLLSAFEVSANFGPATRRRYERLARRTVLTAVLGRDMPAHAGWHVRGGDLHPDDPLSREWTVIVLGSQLATALTARRVDDSDPTGDGQFEAVITHDRDAVIAAAKSVLSRVPGRSA